MDTSVRVPTLAAPGKAQRGGKQAATSPAARVVCGGPTRQLVQFLQTSSRRTTEDGDHTQRQRRLGRTPRVPFCRWQVTLLEQQYQRHNYLSTTAISELAAMLQLSYNRVKIWFQNRRAKERRKEEMKRMLQEGNDYNKIVNLERDPTTASASPSPPAVSPSPPPQYRPLRIATIQPPVSHHERTVTSAVSAFSNYQSYHTTIEGMSTVLQSQTPVTEQCLTDSESNSLSSAV